MKKLFLLLFTVFVSFSFVSVSKVDKEWEEIGTAGGVHFSWRCLTSTTGELKLKNTLEHSVFVAGGYELHDLEESIIEKNFSFDKILPHRQVVSTFSDLEKKRLEFVTAIRLKKLEIKEVKEH